jgi:hypothetical protein
MLSTTITDELRLGLRTFRPKPSHQKEGPGQILPAGQFRPAPQ